jgi:hypothetical protein
VSCYESRLPGILYVAQAGIRLRSFCLSLPHTEITAVHHLTQLIFFLLNIFTRAVQNCVTSFSLYESCHLCYI